MENGAQRMSNKNSIKFLNSNTEGLKTIKQCLKDSKGKINYFHLCEYRQINTFKMRAFFSHGALKNDLLLTFNQEANGNVGVLKREGST